MTSWIQSAACDGLQVGDVAHAMSNRCKHCREHTGSRTLKVLVQRLPDLKTFILHPHFKMLFET